MLSVNIYLNSALVAGCLIVLARGSVFLNLHFATLPPAHPFMMFTEAHTNKKNWLGYKYIRTNKGGGAEAHTNKQHVGRGQKHIGTNN